MATTAGKGPGMTEPGLVEVSVHLAATPETVVAHFTDPARYVQWMGSAVRLEPVPGGLHRVAMTDGFAAAARFWRSTRHIVSSSPGDGQTTTPPTRSCTNTTMEAAAPCGPAAHAWWLRSRTKTVAPGLSCSTTTFRPTSCATGAIVGIVVLTVTDEGFLVDNVAVHPGHRGTGLGRTLLGFAEAEARRAGFDALYRYTHEQMTEDLALYSRIGYVEDDRRSQGACSRVYLRKHLG
jgi:ribosomal protein S18 acetylase RimI-like enzyme